MPAACLNQAALATALAAAVCSGDQQAVGDLLEQYAQVDGSVLLPCLDTLLLQAARLGHQDICALLLAGGATTTAVDAAGCSPLHTAAFRGHVGVCQLLLEAGADPEWEDNEGQTALHKAAFKGHVDVCKLLLTWGCCVDTWDSSGDTALQLCALMQHSSTCMLLLGAGSQAGQLRATEREFVRELVGCPGVPPDVAGLRPPSSPAPRDGTPGSSGQAAGPQAGRAVASSWQGEVMRTSAGAVGTEVQTSRTMPARGPGGGQGEPRSPVSMAGSAMHQPSTPSNTANSLASSGAGQGPSTPPPPQPPNGACMSPPSPCLKCCPPTPHLALCHNH